MGVFSSQKEARQRSYVSMEDTYKKKSQRSKVKDGENVLLQGGRCSLSPLKLIMVFIVCATVITLLHAPPICNTEHFFSHSISRPNIVKKLIWGSPDPRYESQLEINWNDITKTISKLKETEYHSIGLLNFNPEETLQWMETFPEGEHTELRMDYADENVSWETLYPEWIDEEEEEEVPACPSLPRLEVPRKRIDLIAVKLPCDRSKANWSRDVARLHLQLAAAGLAASAKGSFPVHMLFLTDCFPIPNLYTCKELVTREGNAWLYKPTMSTLRDKLRLPVGSCELALPLKDAGYKEQNYRGDLKREAYATILHSADVYVCGAIAAAQSIRMAGSTRDLVILVDETISEYHRSGLQAAGWKTRTIQRIRNPKAEKDAYNEWNYSKFRLWQMTDYDKIIFIDADLLILRNINFLFSMPEISATGNNATLFNSGVMVIEPSNCTFKLLMDHIHEIESYNGGDQGYLNEIFTWWHRIPRHMNFLKHFWFGDEEEVKQKKTRLFGADPPELYVLHYLGMKPWLCFRDYDCNWNSDIFREFASDVAHARWWRVHDNMPGLLQPLCLLRTQQKAQLEWDRREAQKANFTDGHWKIEIKDKRIKKCIDPMCSWKSMLKHWGETNWTDDQPHPSPPTIRLAPLPSS